MKNIKKFICLLIVTVLITPSIAIAEDTYSGYFNNEEITMFADTDTVLTDNEKEAAKDMIASLQNFETTFDISEYNVCCPAMHKISFNHSFHCYRMNIPRYFI